MQTQHRAFFSIIGGEHPSENFLSRLFQACFANSPDFARIVLHAIWRECRLRGSLPRAEWECEYQPATPVPGGGLVDLCIRPNQPPGRLGGTTPKPIFLESKVGSALGESQLKRYREYGTKILIAVTKNWPEVSYGRLRELGVKSLRWQDICRALRASQAGSQTSRFLCNAFAEYLEASGMAYREDLTPSDLEEIRKLLRKISLPRYEEMVPDFSIAHRCLELLQDAKHLFLERPTTFAKWEPWGPGYFHIVEENKITEHVFGFGFFPRTGGGSRSGRWNRHHVFFGVRFPVDKDEPVYWVTMHHRENKAGTLVKYPAISRLLSDEKLDAHKMAETLHRASLTWNIT